ncbi:MAG: MGMT family protein [Prolixibacteraceae bacterium]
MILLAFYMISIAMNFYDRVYYVVRLIPRGRVSTYGMIAKFVGAPKASRMVGWAMNRSNEQEEKVPAHRVVNRKGLLTGKAHFYGDSMTSLLEAEGVKIKENQIINLEEHLWDPFKELKEVPRSFYNDPDLSL